jgi:hypothetical protein
MARATKSCARSNPRKAETKEERGALATGAGGRAEGSRCAIEANLKAR